MEAAIISASVTIALALFAPVFRRHQEAMELIRTLFDDALNNLALARAARINPQSINDPTLYGGNPERKDKFEERVQWDRLQAYIQGTINARSSLLKLRRYAPEVKLWLENWELPETEDENRQQFLEKRRDLVLQQNSWIPWCRAQSFGPLQRKKVA